MADFKNHDLAATTRPSGSGAGNKFGALVADDMDDSMNNTGFHTSAMTTMRRSQHGRHSLLESLRNVDGESQRAVKASPFLPAYLNNIESLRKK